MMCALLDETSTSILLPLTVPPQALAKLNEIKKELKDLGLMKQHSASVSKVSKDIERITQEVKNLETDLEATGSSRTADDVQTQLNEVTANLCVFSFSFLVSLYLAYRWSVVADPTSGSVRRCKPRKNGPTTP